MRSGSNLIYMRLEIVLMSNILEIFLNYRIYQCMFQEVYIFAKYALGIWHW